MQRTRDQARIAWNFVCAFARSLPEDIQRQAQFRRQPRYEIEYEGDGGGHVIRAIAADGKSALGMAPTFALLDERGHWRAIRATSLEHAILSGLGKRGGRALIISHTAPDDAHPFSKWLDENRRASIAQEHGPRRGCRPTILSVAHRKSRREARHWLLPRMVAGASAARHRTRRNTLTTFRLYNRNERVSGETRDLLLTVDEWLACESG